ncbi:MAG: tyrosine-type recombinase/integrase [Cyanobacteria bacterium SBC]|nr:tyrosine-type recombinase/integrase [Cyanobacteria bacterium SBC]
MTQFGKSRSKSIVSIIVSNNSLQLRFMWNRKRRYFSPGLSDNDLHWQKALQIASRLELDILSGNFDGNLDKYRPDCDPSVNLDNTPTVSVFDLWERFEAHQIQQGVSPTTVKVDYGRVRRCLKVSGDYRLEHARKAYLRHAAKYAAGTLRKVYAHLSAMGDWGVNHQLIETNPFADIKKTIRANSKRSQTREAFSRHDRDVIIKAFRTDRHRVWYADFVRFLFFTGCRPEDAIALDWNSINETRIIFDKAYTVGNLGKGKIGKKREFPIGNQLREILESQAHRINDSVNPKNLVFPSMKGNYIDLHNFTNRTWRPLIENLDIERYLPPYNCRHTFITLCLEQGVTAPTIAEWCG